MQCCEDRNCYDQGRICVPESDFPTVVVVGGGFAGYILVAILLTLYHLSNLKTNKIEQLQKR